MAETFVWGWQALQDRREIHFSPSGLGSTKEEPHTVELEVRRQGKSPQHLPGPHHDGPGQGHQKTDQGKAVKDMDGWMGSDGNGPMQRCVIHNVRYRPRGEARRSPG